MGLIVQPRTADVRGRGVIQEFFFDGVFVEPGNGGQPAGDGGADAALGYQLAGEAFDVGAADCEQGQGAGAAPAGELAQVQGVGLACQAAVSGSAWACGRRARGRWGPNTRCGSWVRSLSLDGAVAPIAAGDQMTLGSTE